MTIVAALTHESAYPVAVHEVTVIETHMSWVFLTESRAYKLKKPRRTAFVDFTTVAARKCACEAELRINRRLASSVYLRVIPVTARGAEVRIDGTGEVIDWLVDMRRLRVDDMLDTRIAAGRVGGGDVDRLAAVLTDFYAMTERTPLDGPKYWRGVADDIAAKARSIMAPRYGLDAHDLDAVVRAQNQWLARNRSVFERRAAGLVDAHGDLRPEHVCLESPPVVIDCLEFDDTLRRLDPLSELSFLALECRRLKADWIGARILDRYMRGTRNHAPLDLISFYQSQHALIRAAIAVWHLDDGTLDDAEHWRERGAWYLRTARDLIS